MKQNEVKMFYFWDLIIKYVKFKPEKVEETQFFKKNFREGGIP